MHELKIQAQKLVDEIRSATTTIKLEHKTAKLEELLQVSGDASFWEDSERAQLHMQAQAKLQSEIEPWKSLLEQAQDTLELANLEDETLESDLTKQLYILQKTFESLKKDLTFNGPYDDHAVILAIHAGAGGTDAQDWAQMLLRMYVRWAEQNNFKVHIMSESPGEEAGIKSVELEMSGKFAYGKLATEHGVHRLVRQSPFNADAKRQTSFAKVEVMPRIDRPEEVPLDDADLKIDVYRAGGHGGQSVNTTDSAVRVTHIPTGVVVAIQNERSQLQNKETALTILRSKLAQLQIEQHSEKLSEIKGPNEQAAWGNQIRSYVLHPYKMVKDLRTRHETTDVDGVLDGDLDPFIDAYLETNLKNKT